MKNKQIYALLGSAVLAGSSLSAQNLITNGDFETGISGGGYSSYSNEIGTFANGAVTNNSNWTISNTYATARFVDLLTPNSGWGVRMGNYSSGAEASLVTNTSNLTLTSGDYLFSALHWGGADVPGPNDANDPVTGTSFTATLIGIGSTAGTNQDIGTFVDNTTGGVAQISGTTFTLDVTGIYQLQLTPGESSSGNAWLDNISLTAVPEPSSIGLGSLGFAFYHRKLKK